jgi:uncharacterized protein YaiE (UPF0345 family)
LTVAAGLLVVGGLGTGWSVANRVALAKIAALKPVWLLRAQLRSGGEAAGEAVAELERRRSANLISRQQIQGVADDLLAIQAEPQAAWCPEYPTFLFGAGAAGELTQSQMERMIHQGVQITPRLKPVVRSGAYAIFWTNFDQVRLAETTFKNWNLNVQIEIKVIEATFTPAAGEPVVLTVNSTGNMQTGNLGGSMGSHRKMELPPGDYEVAMKSTIAVTMLSMGEPVEVHGESRMRIKVAAPDEPMVELVTTPELEKEVRQAIRLKNAKKVAPDSIRLDLAFSRTPLPLLGRVVAVQLNDRGETSRFPLTEVHVRPRSEGQASSDERFWPEGLLEGPTRFVFVPDVEIAERADGVTSMWAKPVDLGAFDLAPPKEATP